VVLMACTKRRRGWRKEGAGVMGDALFKPVCRGGGQAGQMVPHGDNAEGRGGGLATCTRRNRVEGGACGQRRKKGREAAHEWA
jgi:hypothetical protein